MRNKRKTNVLSVIRIFLYEIFSDLLLRDSDFGGKNDV